MSVLSRRDFLGSTAAALASGPAFAAMGPNDKFDLVIKGGDVLDPSQNLRGKRDIGIRFTRNNKREGEAWLKPVQTVTGGVPFGRPYNSPFAVR